MIDLHSHILPGIDDGAETLEVALEMARISVQDGTRVLACTPHIVRGVYDNAAANIAPAVAALQAELDARDIDLRLVVGADVHIRPDLVQAIESGEVPRLNGSRYFLFEPPHHVCPPNVDRLAQSVLKAGYVPVLTHPERLTWIARDYRIVTQLDDMGVAVQVTAGALTGQFGGEVERWALRLLDEGRIDIIASDAHSPLHRPPGLSRAHAFIAARIGPEAADRLAIQNPQRMLDDEPLPTKVRGKAPDAPEQAAPAKTGFFNRLFGGG